MDKNEIQRKIAEEEDYIRCTKCGNSITKFVAKNPDGADNSVISRVLMMPEEKIEKIYEESIKILQKEMTDE